VVSVHLGYATPDFHTLLDGQLYLPKETWHEDRQRCKQAGVGDEVVYRPKWQIALEQYRCAITNGVRFAWLTFDEHYGRNGLFLRELDHLGQNYVAEIPVDFMAWTRRPSVLYREHNRDKKRGRKKHYPRLKVKNNPQVEVRNILRYSPKMRNQNWQDYYVKDGSKGPMVWQVKHAIVYLADEQGLPGRPYHLLVTRNALDTNQVKYFISNAPEGTSIEMLLRVAFTRWTIERAFEDSKTELGMDHFEVRKFISIQRHLILSCLSHVFLSEFCLKYRGEKPGPQYMPGANGDCSTLSGLVPEGPLQPQIGRKHRYAIGVNATAKHQSRSQPSTAYN
jgi:SRSO17 transposase